MATKIVCDLCGRDADNTRFTLPHFMCATRGDDTILFKTNMVGTGKYQLCSTCQRLIAMLIDKIHTDAMDEKHEQTIS